MYREFMSQTVRDCRHVASMGLRLMLTIALLAMVQSCATFVATEANPVPPLLSKERLNSVSSTAALGIRRGVILTDNDDAFDIKIEHIRQATSSIDLAYYIYADDYSSSLISRELLAATQRGVKVRMLLDYHSHYKNLDQFLMLENVGNRASGSLDVRFFNQPTQNILRDAVYMTLPCADASDKSSCDSEKKAVVAGLFESETEANLPVGAELDPAYAWAGLFLSGLYGKNPNVMALAVTEGQNIDTAALQSGASASPPEDLEKLKRLGQLYWRANYGNGVTQIANRIKLSAAFALFGEQVNPVYEAFTAFLPVERDEAVQEQARKDWQHLTDFLHHKFLWVDQRHWVLGGRNIEDSYHMNANELSAKYTFMDTDAYLEVEAGQESITATFDRLWNFTTMVADLATVHEQAPNDTLVSGQWAIAECGYLKGRDEVGHAACITEAMLPENRPSMKDRLQLNYEHMVERADKYEQRYQSRQPNARARQFEIAGDADVRYIENLPFDRRLSSAVSTNTDTVNAAARQLGAINGQELDSGKGIHALWQSALADVCQRATPEAPQRVYLHNAYFFMPSNLLSQIAQMIDGRQPCQDVTVVILTNSIETTDLNVVNVLARHSLKALFQHYGKHQAQNTGAQLEYYEYLPTADALSTGSLSLHSKVMVFGDTLYLGSANADLRSYMMDTNNGIIVSNATELLQTYRQWLDKTIASQDKVRAANDYYMLTDRATILAEGDALVDAQLEKYAAERFITNGEEPQEIKRRLRTASDTVYQLSREIVQDHQSSVKAQAQFNALFMLI